MTRPALISRLLATAGVALLMLGLLAAPAAAEIVWAVGDGGVTGP